METVRDHYDQFLGSVYSWILGDFEKAVRRNAAFFDSLNLSPADSAAAVDLGCGPGCQSIPLAQNGYDVLAIDFCQALLDELASHAGQASIRSVRDDLRNFRQHMTGPAELIVCMGDTLVHLPDEATVASVLDEVCLALAPGGRFIYAIRDYFTAVPTGPDRFIPVRSSDERVFTCFLDYEETTVHVHDILHTKVDGDWRMTISDYRKLRLAADTVDQRLAAGGLEMVSRTVVDGMIVGIARRPR